MNKIVDQPQREAALDPARSFIVQAPAGSGKTELLVQRFLKLLSVVNTPEEVLAITFTRKAAGEMRERIINALAAADSDTPPESDHARATWKLARAVRDRDEELTWNLRDHPARLRIQTIDAFNAALTRQLPLLSGYGANPSITDEAEMLYSEAAWRLIGTLEDKDPLSNAVAEFLLHLDNRVDLAEQRLVAMLKRRDQWLPHLLQSPDTSLDALRRAFEREQVLYLEQLSALFPQAHTHDLLALAPLTIMPDADPADVSAWQEIAALLLTDEGAWRKRGKQALKQLIAELQTIEGLDAALHGVRNLPQQARLDPLQERMLEVLFELLLPAVAQLQNVFSERGAVDHIETALRALQALGDEERPTDLALALDYRIQHILVDEFQDTSTTQFRLLEALTRGWSPGDGHSLFLVGDPMQSIYGFRAAEVGLFLRASRQGIGDLPLEFLQLTMNFRAHVPLVEWVNHCFPQMLPETQDIASGAIPFAPSRAVKDDKNASFALHPFFGRGAEDCAATETATVVDLVKTRLDETADGQIAVLVRSRSHAAEIMPALRQAGISFQCRDMERLANQPVVQDLSALVRALAHDGDRTAWLSVLRAPYCGLGLADLFTLAQASADSTLPLVLTDPAVLKTLSSDGKLRIERITPVLGAARYQRGRASLRERVERAWRALGGADVCNAAAIADAEAFLHLLEELDEAGALADATLLDQSLNKLFARPDPKESERVQVLTMHAAKGLEFDTVILAGLHRSSRNDDPRLLLWAERPRVQGISDLILAPLRPTGRTEEDPHYRFVKHLDKQKEDYELCRLLYVAATRAIRRLDLIAAVTYKPKNDALQLKRPAVNTLLHRFWPMIQSDCVEALAGFDPAVAPSPVQTRAGCGIFRVPSAWQVPQTQTPVAWRGGMVTDVSHGFGLEYDWASERVRLTGTVVHRFLEQIANDGLHHWNAERIEAARGPIRCMLAGLGVGAEQLPESEERVVRALEQTIASAHGRWILSAHEQAQSELALSIWGEDGSENYIIDRCFVDNGTRWIVDYKTGYREGGDIEGFLRQEKERHAGQLQRYCDLMAQLHDEPVRAALYFPLLDSLVQYD